MYVHFYVDSPGKQEVALVAGCDGMLCRLPACKADNAVVKRSASVVGGNNRFLHCSKCAKGLSQELICDRI